MTVTVVSIRCKSSRHAARDRKKHSRVLDYNYLIENSSPEQTYLPYLDLHRVMLNKLNLRHSVERLFLEKVVILLLKSNCIFSVNVQSN